MIILIMLYHILVRFEFQFIYLSILLYQLHDKSDIQKTKMSRSINDSFAGWSQSMVTIVNLIDKLHTDLANWSVL